MSPTISNATMDPLVTALVGIITVLVGALVVIVKRQPSRANGVGELYKRIEACEKSVNENIDETRHAMVNKLAGVQAEILLELRERRTR